jgi:hypothetical protein
MDLTQLTSDELLALRERVETTLTALEQAPSPAAAQATADNSAASGGADLEAFESNLKSELERYQRWSRKH